ncbi:hypothetical protein BFX80_08100 [Cobetia marina]|nr:hypothetical protein BFX80_08100 [Cobetia marina]
MSMTLRRNVSKATTRCLDVAGTGKHAREDRLTRERLTWMQRPAISRPAVSDSCLTTQQRTRYMPEKAE